MNITNKKAVKNAGKKPAETPAPIVVEETKQRVTKNEGAAEPRGRGRPSKNVKETSKSPAPGKKAGKSVEQPTRSEAPTEKKGASTPGKKKILVRNTSSDEEMQEESKVDVRRASKGPKGAKGRPAKEKSKCCFH